MVQESGFEVMNVPDIGTRTSDEGTTAMNEKGTSAIEFVLILPILLPILFGIIEYGWVMNTQLNLNNAVSEGVRAVIKEKDAEDLEQVAEAAITEVIGNPAKVNACTSVLIHDIPSRAEVDISGWAYEPLTGFFPSGALPSVLSATAVMVFP